MNFMPPLPPREYAALRESIREKGVLVPVVEDEKGNLLDGRARRSIAKEMGIARVPVRTVSGLSAEAKRHLILELNCPRRQLTTKQKRDLIASELRAAPDLNNKWIGDLIGVTDKTVAEVRRAMEAKSEIPTLAKFRCRDGRNRPSSILTELPIKTADARRILTSLGDDAPRSPLTLERARELANVVERQRKLDHAKASNPDPDCRIEHCDFRQLKLKQSSVDLVFTDPPWNEKPQLWGELAERAAEVLRPGAFLACYCSLYTLPETLSELAKHLNYHWTCAVINEGGHIQFSRKVMSNWQALILLSKGKPNHLKGFSCIADVHKSGRKDKRFHKWQQSLDVPLYFVEYLTKPGALIVDFFAGSGTTAAAAQQLGRRFVGCDIDLDCVKIAHQRLAEIRKANAK